MTHTIVDEFREMLNVLSSHAHLVVRNSDLFHCSDAELFTPIGNVLPLLFSQRSKLSDQPIDFRLLKQLMELLTKDQSVARLNHIGFCYKVASQKSEKQRLLALVRQTKFHIYQEPSNDDGLWFFVGDTGNWEDLMIELIPIGKVNNRWMIDYWLPHIHIDIDTTLTSKEIRNKVGSVHFDTIEPHHISIDGVVYVIRNYLGVMDGVNVFLDIATNARQTKFTRQQILKRLD